MTAIGIVGLAAFLARERRAAAPMLPLSLFAERQFAATNAVTFVVYAALTGATFLLPVVLQVVSGYSPLASGLFFSTARLKAKEQTGSVAPIRPRESRGVSWSAPGA